MAQSKFVKFIKTVVIASGLLLVALALIGLLLPSTWKVERSIVINAPSQTIYPLVANFKTGWAQWSEFDFQDKDIQYTYSGPEEGAGANRTWVSKKMGDGRQTMIKADPNQGVEFDLEILPQGFLLHGKIAFEPVNGNSTKVTWTDWGDVGASPFRHYFALLMDPMMGKTFEKSLAVLKEKAEVAAAAAAVPVASPTSSPAPQKSP